MAEGKKRRVHTAEFKAKVGLEAVRGMKTVTEIAQEYEVHPQLVGSARTRHWAIKRPAMSTPPAWAAAR